MASNSDDVPIHPKTRQMIEGFELRFNEFMPRFSIVYNEGINFESEEQGDDLMRALFAHLEVVSGAERLDKDKSLLTASYGVYRAPTDPGRRDRLEWHLRKERGQKEVDLLEQMDEAYFGAWEVEDSGSFRVIATRLDGQKEPVEKDVVAFVNFNISSLPRRGVWAGWLTTFGAFSALFFCAEIDPRAARKLQKAASRHAWGSGEGFRRQDYEEDVLALTIRPSCIDTGRTKGRVFLHEIIEKHRWLSPRELAADVAAWVEGYGLDTTLDEALDDAQERALAWWSYDEPQAGSMWSIAAARAGGEECERIVELLQGYRRQSITSTIYFEAPIGDKTLEYSLSTDEMLALVGLEPDGRVDHPTAQHALTFPLSVLDADAVELRRQGLDMQWSIEQALRWARQNAAGEVVESLEAAAERHRIAARWAGIVALNEGADAPKPPIGYDELMCGIDHLLPPTAGQTAISALVDPGRGTWTRLEKALRKEGMVPKGRPPLLQELPRDDLELTAIEGVGEVTVEHLTEAIRRFVSDWPASAGHLAAAKSAEEADEAAGELSSGLDELDELF